MTREHIDVVAPLAVFAVLLIYLLVGLRVTNRARTADDFFFQRRRATPSEFLTANVSYSVRLFIILAFAQFAYEAGPIVLLLPLMWLSGFFWFSRHACKLDDYRDTSLTLSGWLGRRFGRSRSIQLVTVMCSILGLVAVFLIDLDYAAKSLASLPDAEMSLSYWTMLFLLFGGFAFWYVAEGGFRTVVRTDVVQLPVALACLSVVLTYCIVLVVERGHLGPGILLAVAQALVLGGIGSSRLLLHRREPASGEETGRVAFVAMVVGLVVCLGACIRWALAADDPLAALSLAGGSLAFSEVRDRVLDPGFWALMGGFMLLNLCWQFVDITSWQRILALRQSRGGRAGDLRRLVRLAGFESAAGWSIGIVVGIAFSYLEIRSHGLSPFGFDLWISFLKEASFGTLAVGHGALRDATLIVVPAALVALVSIALATMDSCVSALLFAVHSDLRRQPVDGAGEIPRATRLTAAGILGASAVAYILFSRALPLDNILAFAYAGQLVLFGVVLSGLTDRRPLLHLPAGAWSLGAGLFGVYVVPVVFYAQGMRTPPWLPVMAGFLGMAFVYLVSGSLARKSKEKRDVELAVGDS